MEPSIEPILMDLTDDPNGLTVHEMMRHLHSKELAHEFNKCSSIIIHPKVCQQIKAHESAKIYYTFNEHEQFVMGLTVRQCNQRTLTSEPDVFVTRLMYPDETEFCLIYSKA